MGVDVFDWVNVAAAYISVILALFGLSLLNREPEAVQTRVIRGLLIASSAALLGWWAVL